MLGFLDRDNQSNDLAKQFLIIKKFFKEIFVFRVQDRNKLDRLL